MAMDIIGPFPKTAKGNMYVLIIGDYVTKWVEAYPMSDMETTTVAKCLYDFICRFGAPDMLHTDQGRNFESALISELCKLLGITKTRTTPYHPQSDGMIERFNRTLLSMLSYGAGEENWEVALPAVMLAYRSSPHQTTHQSPFMLTFGREVRSPVDVMFGRPVVEADVCRSKYALELRNRLETAYHSARHHLGVESTQQKDVYDRSVRGSFSIGDYVWLYCSPIPRGRSAKFHRPWKGPYIIVKALNDVVYRIRNVDAPRKKLVVHFNRLKPYNHDFDQIDEARIEDSGPVQKSRKVPKPSGVVYLEELDESEDEELMYPPMHVHKPDPGQDLDNPVAQPFLVPDNVPELPADIGIAENAQQAPPLRRSTRNRKPPDRY